jgi:hypothetical protein
MNFMNKFYLILLCILFSNVFHGFSQSDNPWSSFASLDWNNNSNITEFGSGSNAGYTVTTEASIGNPTAPSCGSATNDLWYRVPFRAGTTSVTVKVTFTNSDYSSPIDDTRPRYAIYKAPTGSCTASGSCNLSYYSCNSDNDLDENGEDECFGSSLYYTNLQTNNVPVNNEDVFIRIWEQDNDADHRYTIHVVRNGTSQTAPNNDACSSPQLIVSGSGCSNAGTNYGAGGGGYPALGSDACNWGLQENNVFYEFEATATTANIQFQGVRCFWTGCTNVPGLALQYAIFRKRTNCTSTSYPGDVVNVPSNAAYDCFIGTGTVGGLVDGLTIGQRYIIVLDGWNGSPCAWDGITINNIPSIPTVNNVNKCIADTGTTSTLTISNTRTGYTYAWTASPADPTLVGQTTNAVINVRPLTTTTYTCTINLGSNGNLCNGNSAASYQVVGVVNILDPVGSRITPTGAQCSGTQLNFTSNPTGGNGTYTYIWSSNNPSGTTGSGQNFSFTPTNNTCNDILLNVNLSVRSNGLTCARPTAFTPTIRPNPTLSAAANVDCLGGIVTLARARTDTCICTDCSYTLTACTGCGSGSTPIGTTNTTGTFNLYDASGASFTTTKNGCTSATRAINFLVDCPTQLPVELTQFSGKCAAKKIVLNWQTASEYNSHYFTVLKSEDAIHWREIGHIDAMRFSNNINNYEFIDNDISANVNYYKLKETDLDNSYYFSDAIIIRCNEDFNQDVFTTVQNGILYIDGKHINSNLRIYNTLAQLMIDHPISNMLHTIDLNHLSNGVYILQYATNGSLNAKKMVLTK